MGRFAPPPYNSIPLHWVRPYEHFVMKNGEIKYPLSSVTQCDWFALTKSACISNTGNIELWVNLWPPLLCPHTPALGMTL